MVYYERSAPMNSRLRLSFSADWNWFAIYILERIFVPPFFPSHAPTYSANIYYIYTHARRCVVSLFSRGFCFGLLTVNVFLDVWLLICKIMKIDIRAADLPIFYGESVFILFAKLLYSANTCHLCKSGFESFSDRSYVILFEFNVCIIILYR